MCQKDAQGRGGDAGDVRHVEGGVAGVLGGGWEVKLCSNSIKSLSIKNFRCFDDAEIELAIPNGSVGSGLTLLVGENGTGKTSILDAIDLGLGGKFRAESRISIKDFRNFEKEVEIECQVERYRVGAGSDFMKGKYFNCLGSKVVLKGRDRKAPGKFLSSSMQANCLHIADEDFYYDKDDEPFKPDKTVDARDKIFSPDQVGDGLSVFYFDKNRARHLVQGTYRTTFEAICDDLNWKFRKELSLAGKLAEYRKRASDDSFDWVLSLAQPHTGERLADAFSDFFGDDDYKNLRLDLFELLEPFSTSSFTVRDTTDLVGIAPKKLGSGIELVLAILLQKFLSDQAKGQKIFMIDEPELHLHPRAQEKLGAILLDEARNSQIVISSHSPYLLKVLARSCSMVVCRKTDGTFEVAQVSRSSGLFPWSPSFGEVNYLAFRIPTIEFFNELYGYIMERNVLRRSSDLDAFLISRGERNDMKWVMHPSKTVLDVTLATYVRHDIHHPENSNNLAHTSAELVDAIEMLRRHL